MVAHVKHATIDVSTSDQPAENPQIVINPISDTDPSQISSEEIMCVEIHMEAVTPENIKYESISDSTTQIRQQITSRAQQATHKKNNPGKRRAKAQVEATKGEDSITL